MKIPNTLIVFGQKYSLKLVSGLESEGAMGKCSPKSKTIQLDSDLRGDDRLETLLHELFHAGLFETSITQGLDQNVEEIIVDALARLVVSNFNLRCKK